MILKALTVCQPYAELIARMDPSSHERAHEKPLENRAWKTSYRGPLLIHAGKSKDWLGEDDEEAAAYAVDVRAIAFGAFVARAVLIDCIDDSMRPWPRRFRHLQDHEHAHGPFCLVLERVERLRVPVPALPGRNHQGLWVPTETEVKACRGDIGAQRECFAANGVRADTSEWALTP